MSEVLIIDGDERLPQLASKINEAHADVEAQLSLSGRHLGYALEKAVILGDALNAAKDALGHGQWLPWLDANCPTVKPHRATSYMRLSSAAATGALEIGASTDLSINDAIAQLRTPRKAVKGDNQLSPPLQREPNWEGAYVTVVLDMYKGGRTGWDDKQLTSALLAAVNSRGAAKDFIEMQRKVARACAVIQLT